MSEPSSTTSRRGMVATSHPLAVDAGLEVLATGGNAADAAVAAAAVLTVVDPRSTGIGGDAFAQVWPSGTALPEVLEAAGPAPAGLTVDALRAAGHEAMPTAGPWTVTVPGAVAGWETLLARFGTREPAQVLAPAIRLAEEGFEVTRFVAEEWASTVGKLAGDAAAAETFLPGGRSPAAGERFVNPALARVLRAIGDGGASAFYRGEPAERIGRAVEAVGGPLRAADLADWAGPRWVKPISLRYRGVDVFEPPPPGQGVIILEALGILEGLEGLIGVDRVHATMEAIKLAFADAHAHVADPLVASPPVGGLLAPGYLAERRGSIDARRAAPAAAGSPSDTVYVATADGDGMACSFIQSLYDGFGSGVGVPGTGIVLQNRGAGFVLAENHPNRPEPGKRPYHTIVPGMLGRDGAFLGALGVVGGFMQPQAQVQILQALLDDREEPQAALARPRFRVLDGVRVGFEAAYDPAVVRALAERGHEVAELSRFEAGGAQLILRSADGFRGASDPRKDGRAGGG